MTVRQMASLVHPSSASRRVMVVLRAYFDESGLHSNSGVFALSGYVAPEKEWKRLESRWHTLLQKPLRYDNPKISAKRAAAISHPLEYLHATEMEGMGKGRFRALGQRNRDYLVSSSVSIVLSSGVIGISSAIILPEYERLDEKTREVIGEPYLLCFQFAVTEVAKKARLFLGEDHSEDIAYIFEQHPLWQEKATNLWNSAVAQGYKTKYRMGSVTFEDKKKFIPLQAADRYAFETYQHFACPSHSRDTWKKLMDSPQHRGKFFDRGGFESLIEQCKGAGRL
jgi:hypothetical protein